MAKGFQGKRKGSLEEKRAIAKAQRAKKKGTTKGEVRKTARRAYEPKRKSSRTKRKSSSSNTRKKSNSMPKRKTTRRVTQKAENFLKKGMVGKAVTGIGAAALVGTVMNRILPGSPITNLAQPIAAYAAGGGVGAVASVLLSGGLNSITGFLGGQQNGTTQVGQMEFGV